MISYDFTIQYCQDTLNSADELSWRSDYMMKQSERHHENNSTLICFEKFQQNEKHHESNSTLIHFQKFQSIHENNSTSVHSEKSYFQNEKYHKSLTLWQIDDLMSTLVNKFMIAVLEVNRQYSYHIRETDFKTENLIQVLSLQAIT